MLRPLASRDPVNSPRRATLGQALWPFAVFLSLALLVLQGSRVGLIVWQYRRVADVEGLGPVLLQGLRFDLLVLGMVLALPGLVGPLLFATRRTLPAGRVTLSLFLAVALTLIFFMELATPAFLEEYDVRPNYLFVEYLRYPREVLATLWGAYPVQIVATALAVPAALFGSHRLLARAATLSDPLRPGPALALALALPALCVLAARSSLAHRPANPSSACFSSDPMVNSLPLSSLYSVSYAIYETERNEGPDVTAYGELPYEDVLEIVRAGGGFRPDEFPDPAIPTLHHQASTRPRARPLNLVIVLEESLGAEFVGAMGGLPLTPRLDRLLTEGLSFDNLYATGTRSVRGIEAVVTGFLPTPVPSVVKQPRSQTGFFSVAELLRRRGYATSFLYGGEAHFDNMRRFFTGNGFEHVIDHKDFEDPYFEGSWGVSDQDLFRRAHAYFEGLGDTPFCSLVFSSSNHSPWDFPHGEIELYEEPAATRHNAVKYADHALGEFFDLARSSSYWDDTLFLVVADHNSRVYGPALVPVEHFHVPCVFLGGSIAPGRVTTLASQIDLIPTALSLLGIDSDHPAIGRDLTDPARLSLPGRAILQFHESNLFLEGDRAVLLRPNFKAETLRWTGTELVPLERDRELERRALGHALWPQMAYRAGDYRLPPQE